MKNIFIAAALLAASQFSGAIPCAAGAPYMDLTIENLSSGGDLNPLYRVSGSQVSLDIQNNGFQNDPFAKYSINGIMFGRPTGFNNSIQNDTFGGTYSVIVDAEGFYAKFSRQSGWPELRVDTRVDQNSDPRAVVLLSVLANYLPALTGASANGGMPASQSYTIRQFGDSVQVDGAGLSNVRLERQNYTYTVRGSGFGKDFDGADRLVLELDNVFLGTGGLRVRGCGMDLEVKRDDFGGPRLNVRGTAGDSGAIAAFTLSLARYLNGAGRAR